MKIPGTNLNQIGAKILTSTKPREFKPHKLNRSELKAIHSYGAQSAVLEGDGEGNRNDRDADALSDFRRRHNSSPYEGAYGGANPFADGGTIYWDTSCEDPEAL